MDLSMENVEGEGTPLVFVHGWLGSSDSWRQVRKHLELDNPMLFYDQRCHGESPCEPFDFDDLADDLHRLVEQQGMEEPVLVGHSMGGMMALTYAVRYGDVAGLVLLGTCASTPEPEVENPQFYLENFHTMERERWAEMIADNYMGRSEGDLRRLTVKELMAADETPVRSGLEAMVDYDLREELEALDIPTVVVGGQRDGAITPDKVQELAVLLACTPQMLDSSHLMLQEVPGKVAEKVEGFVRNGFQSA